MIKPGTHNLQCPQCGSPFHPFVTQDDIHEYLNNPNDTNSWLTRCCEIDVPIQKVFDMIVNGVEVEPW